MSSRSGIVIAHQNAKLRHRGPLAESILTLLTPNWSQALCTGGPGQRVVKHVNREIPGTGEIRIMGRSLPHKHRRYPAELRRHG